MNKTAQEVKLADEARSHLSMEVHQRTSKIEKLKKRYEIITLAMQTPDGEEEMSQESDRKNEKLKNRTCSMRAVQGVPCHKSGTG